MNELHVEADERRLIAPVKPYKDKQVTGMSRVLPLHQMPGVSDGSAEYLGGNRVAKMSVGADIEKKLDANWWGEQEERIGP